MKSCCGTSEGAVFCERHEGCETVGMVVRGVTVRVPQVRYAGGRVQVKATRGAVCCEPHEGMG